MLQNRIWRAALAAPILALGATLAYSLHQSSTPVIRFGLKRAEARAEFDELRANNHPLGKFTHRYHFLGSPTLAVDVFPAAEQTSSVSDLKSLVAACGYDLGAYTPHKVGETTTVYVPKEASSPTLRTEKQSGADWNVRLCIFDPKIGKYLKPGEPCNWKPRGDACKRLMSLAPLDVIAGIGVWQDGYMYAYPGIAKDDNGGTYRFVARLDGVTLDYDVEEVDGAYLDLTKPTKTSSLTWEFKKGTSIQEAMAFVGLTGTPKLGEPEDGCGGPEWAVKGLTNTAVNVVWSRNGISSEMSLTVFRKK